jgi:hypothetical protein
MESFIDFMKGRSKSNEDQNHIIEENKIEEPIIEKVQPKEEPILLSENVEVVTPTGYKIYRDKSETFVCDMEISGANPNNSKARIIIESKNLTYMFEGSIDSKGQCKIPLKKMNFLEENESGTIKLEVIAEDMVFNPWEDAFVAVNSKKVSVKINESEEITPKVGVRISNIR